MELDKIDREILERVRKLSGSQAKEIIQTLGNIRAEGTIRTRMDALEIQGCVLQDRKTERGKVFVTITSLGIDLLEAGRTREPASEEVNSHV